MEIVCLLFDGITALDIVGPYEVLQRLPEAEVKFVARSAGEIRTDNKLFDSLLLRGIRDLRALLTRTQFGEFLARRSVEPLELAP